VTARITAPSGAVETVRFAPPGGDGEWGVFASIFMPTEPGKHERLLACKETGDPLEASMFVQGSSRCSASSGSAASVRASSERRCPHVAQVFDRGALK